MSLSGYWSRFYTDELLLGLELDDFVQGGTEAAPFVADRESMVVALPRLSRMEIKAIRIETAEDIERELARSGRKAHKRDWELREDAEYLRRAA